VKRDFVSLADVTAAEIEQLVVFAGDLKQRHRSGTPTPLLTGKTLALLFDKPSLRTRASFEVGMYQLGGYTTYMQEQDIGMGVREPIKDLGRILSRYYDGIVIRTFAHDAVAELAQVATIPVINGLTDLLHPCQILAALQTLQERFGRYTGLHVAYIGDGNNVANSWLLGAAQLGLTLTIACPPAYRPDAEILHQASAMAEKTGTVLEIVDDPRQGVKEADVVYTDVWTSMGQESEAAIRREVFRPYQINTALLAEAPRHAVESPRALVFEEAENRLHVQKALLVFLLTGL
jgi:ornithine carbamoyltransferase